VANVIVDVDACDGEYCLLLVVTVYRWRQTHSDYAIHSCVAPNRLQPPTLQLAGTSVPPGWVLDGHAAAELLLTGVGSSQRNDTYVYFPQFAQRSRGLDGSGIYAARSGRWKTHWFVQGSLQCGQNNSDAICSPSQPYERLATSLVFDIEVDPGERYPLELGTAEYDEGLAATSAVALDHVARMVWWPEPLLNAGPFDTRLQPCCRAGCEPFPTCCHCGDDPRHYSEPCASPTSTAHPLWWLQLRGSDT
jgi:hypothetical protein